ncbi:MAG TPA: CCA tRNA nucleotidyltransferase [Rhizomicrobium sp.]|jgi:poly(A) polymerase
MRLDPSREAWMHARETRAVMDALLAEGGDARFVGGAVRNTLLDRKVDDVDIATPLRPADVTRRLGAAQIAAVPTGVEHGTITAVVCGKAFEVTTLRRDVATDGRHAVVAFSSDWAEDAARRDFTINALYASIDGEVFDFVGGLDDLKSGRVRFIGDPVARIREDYLRILRLFRFHAWYGKGAIDEQALRATASESAGLPRLSGERVQKELLRLLEAESPMLSLRAMADTAVLAEILPGAARLDRLERLVGIDSRNFFKPDSVLRLAALLSDDLKLATTVAQRLRLSNENRERLEDLASTPEKVVAYLSVREVHRLLYRLGAQRFKDRVFLRWADDARSSNAVAWRALLALADAWVRPRFPLTGRDVMMAGVPEGPSVGRVLAEVEEWWIDSDFTDDRFSLAERLKAVVQAGSF